MKRILKALVPILFFSSLVLLGCLIYKDYGIPWDELIQTQIGALNFRYIFRGDHSLLSFSDRYYGAIFEVPLLWLSSRLSLARHLAIFLVFVAGVILFYFLCRRLFHSDWWALLGAVLLAISPRIFADAFYNSKDIPFLVMAIAAVWTLVILSDALSGRRQGWSLAAIMCLHAGASALFISTRVPGVMILPLTILLLVIKTIESPASWKRILAILLGYLALSIGLTILFWPILWKNPWNQFITSFSMMSQYPYGRPVLFEGQFFLPVNLPWVYLPVWIAISTPLVVLAGIPACLVEWIWKIISFAKIPDKTRFIIQSAPEIAVWLVVIGWLVIPLGAIYLFHSVVYDGWRQLFFIYPAILLISVRGLVSLFHWMERLSLRLTLIRIVVGVLLLIGVLEPVWFMVRYHPYENVYFNILAGNGATLRQRFEMDYWGLSYKQGIDFILANDPGKNIKIYVADPPGLDYINSGLTSQNKARLIAVKDPANANYFVGVFRWHPEEYDYGKQVYSANVRGAKIMEVDHLR